MDAPPLKRTRVPLSCNQCRASKQKCDRGRPACSQCVRRSQTNTCRYADRPERMRHGRGVAARLQRLEGMVRGMMDEGEGGGGGGGVDGRENGATNGSVRGNEEARREQEPATTEKGTVVSGRRATSYVGATHFMAILEDIEDLKSYFDDPEEPEEESPPSIDATDLGPELLLFSAGEFRSKDDLLKILPGKPDMDRLIMRYFSEFTTSQHIIHRPTFSKQYGRFCKDPHNTPINWIALLFGVLAIGLIVSPLETPDATGATTIHGPERMAQIKTYRAAAGWALVYGRYTQAGIDTIPPLLLFVESEMSINTSSQVGCYVLLGVCVRLMLKVGLHRDPSKLPNISPFDAEMRRRMWSLAVTVDLLVSFHVGLPSIIQGIESDTALPQNIVDEDFDQSCTELPRPRPPTEYTALSYPINKCAVSKVFGKIAAHSHSLTPPSYAEVQRLDQLLVDTWAKVPWTMKPRPLEECITNHPHQIMQRAGLNSLFHKSLCVLHRRYLTEPIFRPEHAVSRKKCLQSALELLRRHDAMWQDIRPGHMFSSGVWFFSVITVYDFLLASAIVYICVQSPTYPEGDVEHPWFPPGTAVPTKTDLVKMLKSHGYWVAMMEGRADFRKVTAVVGTMLKKLAAVDGSSEDAEQLHIPTAPEPPQAASMNTATGMSTSGDESLHSFSPTPETTWTSSSMFDSGASMGTCGSGVNPGVTASDAGVNWQDFENMVTASFPSAESEMLDSELSAWLEAQSSDMTGLNFTTPGLQG